MELLCVVAVVAVVAALVVPAIGRAYSRAKNRVELVKAWHWLRVDAAAEGKDKQLETFTTLQLP